MRLFKKRRIVAGIFVLMLVAAGFCLWQPRQLLPHGDLGLFISTGKMLADPGLSTLGKGKLPLVSSAAGTLVLQLKDSDGLVAYKSPAAEKWKVPVHQPSIDLGLITGLKARGFRTVAYFQVFKDKAFVDAYPSEGITDLNGRIFRDKYGAFVDPGSEPYREYFFSLIAEVLAYQPDEIMLDYIRFPEYSGLVFPVSKISEDDVLAKEKIITGFVRQLREFIRNISPKTKLSCSIFPPDNSIGQNYRDLCASADIISPMIYPNVFNGTVGGEMWKQSFNAMIALVQDQTTNTPVMVRPFIQGFQFYRDAGTGSRKTKSLEPDLMRWQIQRVQDLNWGYLVFSSSSSYGNVWRELK